MSAPFPSSSVGQVGTSRVVLIPERGEFIPPSYVPHEKPETVIVKQGGKPIAPGFTVAEMLPERRWAVGPEGEVMPQLEFAERYQQKLLDWYRFASQEGQQGRGRVPSSFAVHREPVPSVVAYVAARVDPRDSRKTLPMGYDPDATQGATPKRLWNSDEERFLEGSERMTVLVDAYRIEEAGGRRTLRKHEREEVEAHLSGTRIVPVVANATQAKIALLTQLRSEGTLDDAQYAEQVARLFGVREGEAPAPPKRKPTKMGHSVMACGEQVVNTWRSRHLKRCEVCQEAASSS